MLTAVTLSLLVGLPTTAVVVLKTVGGQDDVAAFQTGPATGMTLGRGVPQSAAGDSLASSSLATLRSFETARRALEDYGVVGQDDCVDRVQDWRQRPM